MDDIKRQLVDEWLFKADEDLRAASVLHGSKLHAPALAIFLLVKARWSWPH